MQDSINTIVRFHDVRRLPELERCIFSLVGQEYRPLHIILALQRFTPGEIAETQTALAPILAGENDVKLTFANYDEEEPADARSALLNMGVRHATGRFLAFLDYDDVLYPEAYQLMISRLQRSGAAIAFAAVRVMRLDVYESFLFTVKRVRPPFNGSNLVDLFRNNFCPLHSYVMDRSQISGGLIQFNTSLIMEEDYDVLLRVCAKYHSDFSLIRTNIGDYYYKSDGSNTVPTDGGLTGEARARYMEIRWAIEETRRTTVLSREVQEFLGLEETAEPLTIRDVLKKFPPSRVIKAPGPRIVQAFSRIRGKTA